MLVIRSLLDDLGADGVPGLPVVLEVLEATEPLREAGRLAVGAGPRDGVEEVGCRDGADEDVEGGL